MSVKLEIDLQALKPVVQAVVAEVLAVRDTDTRLALNEQEAALAIGVKPHVLRDCRRRGELAGVKIGRKTVYLRSSLVEFLEANAGLAQRHR